jgi:hypothetical protein
MKFVVLYTNIHTPHVFLAPDRGAITRASPLQHKEESFHTSVNHDGP